MRAHEEKSAVSVAIITTTSIWENQTGPCNCQSDILLWPQERNWVDHRHISY